MRRIHHTTATLICILLLFSPLARGEKSSFSVRFETLTNNGGAVVTVRLSDTVSGKFLIDTGTSVSGITAATAAKLNLKPLPAIGTDGTAIQINGIAVNAVEVQNLQVGDLTIPKCPLVIFEHGELKGWGEHLDGILGATFLINSPLLIDFAKHQVIFWQEGNLNILLDYRILIDVRARSLYLQPYDNAKAKVGDATHTIHYTSIGKSRVPFLPVNLNFGSTHLFAFAPGSTTPSEQLQAAMKHKEGEINTYKIKPVGQEMPHTITLTIKKLL